MGIKYRLPSWPQWRQLLKILNKKERIFFFVLSFLVISSFFFLSVRFYFKNTEVVPGQGGIYKEGALSSPGLINPIYAASSDTDRDLAELIFSGLLKYDKDGKIIPDLAEEYKVEQDGKVYEFKLKENLLWQDDQPLTVDDVIFTVKTLQNPSFKSPIRINWLGVETEKIDERTVRFTLQNPSAVFLENCTLKIMPQHIWQDISSQNFPRSIYNLEPVGSGPYKFADLKQNKEGSIKTLELVINNNYWGEKPHIVKIIFKFFDTEEELISAFKAGQIEGLSIASPEEIQKNNLDDYSKETNEYEISLPRYFAIFFNSDNSKPLADLNIRQALNYGIDKEGLVKDVLLGKAEAVDSPVLPSIYGLDEPEKIYQPDQDKANEILDAAGFSKDESGLRAKTVKKDSAFQFKSNLKVGSQSNEVMELQKCLAKDPEVYPNGKLTGVFGEETKAAVIKFQEKYKSEILDPQGLTAGTGEVFKSTRDKLNALCAASQAETLSLSFNLTVVNQPIFLEVASAIKKQWEAIGVKIEIKAVNSATFAEEIIRPRNYEMLLFGETLGTIADPYPFWHSSQIKDPGLNLSGYQNKEADKLLEDARQNPQAESRKTSLEKFQNIVIADAPAIFLYSPDFIYLIKKDFKGFDNTLIVDPSKRFSDIGNWYVNTKRAWK